MTRNTRRRIVSQIAVMLCALSVILALIPLGLILFFVTSRGVQSLNWDFFTKLPVPVGESGGGMANAIAGTLMLTGFAALGAVPVGIICGVYLSSTQARDWHRRRASPPIRSTACRRL
jgi:phosphate transport system permease protein